VYNVGVGSLDIQTLEAIYEEVAELAATAVLRGVPFEYAQDVADLQQRLRQLIQKEKV
jgi:hypothetical protein